MSDRRVTSRFDGATIGAIALVTVGTVFGEPALFVAASVPLFYLLVEWTTGPPEPNLTVERRIEPDPAAPGERTEITLSVHNEGASTLTDLRVVDRLPEGLPVEDGSPRGCLSIRPGETASVEYTVVPKQGTYAFDSPVVRARSLSATGIYTASPDVTGATTLTCRRDAGEVPQLRGSLRRFGTRPVDRGGEGLRFYAAREYQLGDDVRRINWRDYAKTGDLTTVQFAETSATETVVLVDATSAGRVARESGYPTATELTVYAADRVVARLLADGDDVGVCALGIDASDVAVPVSSAGRDQPWVPPGSDDATRTRVDAVFDALVAATDTDSARTDRVSTDLRERLPARTDVVVVTPALDSETAELATSLSTVGHRVGVVSPDVTDRRDPGRTVAHVERQLRLTRLRGAGTTVFDWDTRRSLAAAMEVAR